MDSHTLGVFRSICTSVTVNNTPLLTGCYNANLLITSPASSVTIWRQNMSVIILALFLQLWDIPLIMHVWKKGKCRHKHSLPPISPLIFPRRRFLASEPALDAAAVGSISLSALSFTHSLYQWRLSVFIVQRVTRQPANGGLPRPRWASGGLNRLCDSRPHRQGLPYSLCGGIELRVCFCLSGRFHCIIMGSLSNPRKPESVVACSKRFISPKLRANFSGIWHLKMYCLLASAHSQCSTTGCCFVQKWCYSKREKKLFVTV